MKNINLEKAKEIVAAQGAASKMNLHKGNEILYQFNNLADDGYNLHKVYITQGNDLGNDGFTGKVLSIDDTPGAWYLDTLFNFRSDYPAVKYDTISIQGKDWHCKNWQEIIKELHEYLKLEPIG